MKTIVYVDGFNLYYRALKNTGFKWLNLAALAQAVLPEHCEITAINFYTARISARMDPTSPRDQHIYLKALATLPNLTCHFGNFQVADKFMYLSQPLSFRPELTREPIPLPKYAKVVKTEEKGSDVNLGVHLVRDAFMERFEHAAVITNDTDLCEPLKIVTKEAGLPVTLITPVTRPAPSLVSTVTYVRHLSAYLGVAQFPYTVLDTAGNELNKPDGW